MIISAYVCGHDFRDREHKNVFFVCSAKVITSQEKPSWYHTTMLHHCTIHRVMAICCGKSRSHTLFLKVTQSGGHGV